MNIAITGATGFIGTELVKKHIENNDFVKILTRKDKNLIKFPKNVKIFNGDLLDSNSTCLIDFLEDTDVLYHCAAEIKDESKMYQTNIVGTQNLISAAIGNVRHWVQLSSTGVYGSPSTGIISESNPLNPQNIYEKTKLTSDEIVLEAGLKNNLSITILRPSNVFGSEMRNQSLYQLIKMVDKGLFFFIGKKGSSANYISVENVVKALIICGQDTRARGKIFILSDWSSIESFIKIIARELNKPLPKIRINKVLMKLISSILCVFPKNPITLSRVDALTKRTKYSSDFIKKELNYSHSVSMEYGISKLVLSYKKNNL